VITSAGWLDCMPENLSLSITACADIGVTRYECGEGWSCITVYENQRWSVVGASVLELEPSEQGGSQNEWVPNEARTSER